MKILLLDGGPPCFPHVTGTLALLGVVHQVVRPCGPLPGDLSSFQAVLVSDFPHRRLRGLENLVVRAHTEWGLGLAMFGGPGSFAAGGYAETPLGALLPVTLGKDDETVRLPGGMALDGAARHPILRGARPDRALVICGFNRVQPRPQTTTVLSGRRLRGGSEGIRLGAKRTPLLVLKESSAGAGRCAAFATSFTPPWCGGLSEWGTRMLDVGDGVAVGESYATLLMNLVRWVAGEERIGRPMPSLEELALSHALRQPEQRVMPPRS